MKKIVIICLAAAMSSCGIYKSYERPDVQTDGLYGAVESTDGNTIGQLDWQEMFTDAQLQALIAKGLENNTDLKSAKLKVDQTHAALKSARLAYLPSLNFAPEGSLASFDNSPVIKTYTIPVAASWQVDIFNGLTNAKRRARAMYDQSKEYEQAVRSQIIAGIANLYYSLLMLDAQLDITEDTAAKWAQSVEMMRAMKDAGMANEAAVAQYEGTYLSIKSSLEDLAYSRTQVENSLCTLLAEAPHHIERSTIDAQQLPDNMSVGLPVQMLSNRPDVRLAEYSLMSAYYATASARSALYPSISLSGVAGWTNNAGSMVVNPGKLILNAAASLLQPIFNAGGLRAQVKIAKAQQQEALLGFEQTLINAGAEVNNALAKCQAARQKADLRAGQVAAMARAVEATELMQQHSSTTYLEVLTAQQSLLSARLAQVADKYDELSGTVNLYQALGGGCERVEKK